MAANAAAEKSERRTKGDAERRVMELQAERDRAKV
jgi:hypothetical protein